MAQQGPNDPKPGRFTTEFYQSLLLQVVALVVAVVTIFKPDFNLDSFQVLIPMIAAALAAITQVVYTMSRTKVKVAALTATTMSEPGTVTDLSPISSANTTATIDVVPTALGVNGAVLRNA